MVSQYTHWGLPSKEFEGVWESLLYEDEEEPPTLEGGAGGGGGGGEAAAQKRPRSDGSAGQTTGSSGARGSVEGELSGSRLKPALLQYASSAMLFADAGVDAGLISCNHVILLHGPPGTGKTSLCKALAHKLSIRLGDRYPSAQLIEINAHSLFSRWFSESGKLVHRLFAHIREMVEDEDCLVMLLIDEVESLTAARKAAVSGSEPSDAVRVVNAVLTAIDSFRTKKNVLLLTTSNVSEAIDVAFVDRADVSGPCVLAFAPPFSHFRSLWALGSRTPSHLHTHTHTHTRTCAQIKALVGPPGRLARYDIIASCVRELVRVGLVALSPAGATLGSAREASAAAALAEKQAPGSSSSSSSSSSSGSSEGRGGVGSAGATGATASGEGGSGAGSAAAPPPVDLATMASLWRTACASHGFSGRTLRKLPLAAHALFMRGGAAGGHSRERRAIAGLAFAEALHAAVREERASRVDFKL